MALRFSDDGPEFPDELVDAVLDGSAVFLCGAGVSAPQLPGFHSLVEKVYSTVGADFTPDEAEGMSAHRYEEVLGALSRRLSDRNKLMAAVRAHLTIKDPNLEAHKILIRLSRSLDNRITLVTTNFDTFFEQAIEQLDGKGQGKQNSVSGQALTPPGSPDFFGVVHLHGRLADEGLGLDETPLVLTSAQYGEAYMRAGWASRFLFDLIRCRTLILVGYSGGDAPVRYFLNVLEADRERFSDLKDVYALDFIDKDESQARRRWGALAVRPLTYRQGRQGASSRHTALWRDLGALADLADRPKTWRRDRAAEILAKPLESQSQAALETINWIYRGKRDVWDVAIRTVQDPRWFDHFHSQKLLGDDHSGWVLAAWCALDWTSAERLQAAIAWRERGGSAFGQALDQRLSSSPPGDPLFSKAWRLLARTVRPRPDFSLKAYRIAARLEQPGYFDSDLRGGVALLRPELRIDERYERRSGLADGEVKTPTRLSSLYAVRLSVDDRGGLVRIGQALRAVPSAASRLLQIATEELQMTVEVAREIELIGADWDLLDSGVASVEAHGQNEYRDGVTFLVEFLTDMLPKLVAEDLEQARTVADGWRDIPSVLGPRLWLHAMRNPALYTPDEVAAGLSELPSKVFWSARRELVLVIVERLAEAAPDLIAGITTRILAEGPRLYADFDLEEGQDWRPQVRDREVWLRLAALRRAGLLLAEGQAELDAIAERHPYITGDFEERDLFGSYSYPVRSIAGDPRQLAEANPDERLDVAHRQIADWNPDVRLNWSAYCHSDPDGALAALKGGGLDPSDAGLWNDLLGALAWFPKEEEAEARKRRLAVILDVFAHLNAATDPFIDRVSARLVDLWADACNAAPEAHEPWWNRIWASLERAITDDTVTNPDRFYDRVINHPAGRHAERLIAAINRKKTKKQRISSADRARLHAVFVSDTVAGWYGRGACARDAGFLLYVDRLGVIQKFRPRLAADDLQAQALRAVLVETARLARSATAAFKSEISRGILESTGTGEKAGHVASKILIPLFQRSLAGKVDRGFSNEEARALLKQASPSIREGAAHVFKVWVKPNDMVPESAWRKAVKPVFEAVWPPERNYQSAAHTSNLAALCVGAGDAFPEAFEVVRPYLLPLKGDWANFYFLTSSEAPKRFPRITLDLLWTLCGPSSPVQSSDLGEVLAIISEADPALVLDRRYQWLDQRVPSYG